MAGSENSSSLYASVCSPLRIALYSSLPALVTLYPVGSISPYYHHIDLTQIVLFGPLETCSFTKRYDPVGLTVWTDSTPAC